MNSNMKDPLQREAFNRAVEEYKVRKMVIDKLSSQENSSFDPTGFWEFDRLTGAGIKFDLSGWLPFLPVVGGDIALDIIYNFKSDEIIALVTPSGMLGLGEGLSGTIGFDAVYDAHDANSLQGPGFGGQLTAIVETGGQASYSSSKNPGLDGKYAQIWQIGPGAGGELSASGSGGYSFLLIVIPLNTNNK